MAAIGTAVVGTTGVASAAKGTGAAEVITGAAGVAVVAGDTMDSEPDISDTRVLELEGGVGCSCGRWEARVLVPGSGEVKAKG